MKPNEKQRSSMKLNEKRWNLMKTMKLNEKQWNSMKLYEKPCNETQWTSMEKQWNSMKNNETHWKLMKLDEK